MHDIYHLNVKDTLPSSIASDAQIQTLSELLTIKLLDLVPYIDRLALLPNLPTLTDAVIDELAWHLHVDFYSPQLSREQKETLIYQSIAWHRKKGTVGIVEDMVKTISSYAEVIENWDYSGEPYHFIVEIESNESLDTNVMNQVMASVQAVKNVRSWIDHIEQRKSYASTLYSAAKTVLNAVDISVKNLRQEAHVVHPVMYGGVVLVQVERGL